MVTGDAGRLFLKTTNDLEGDGPLVACCCQETLETILRSIQVGHYPNTDAVIAQLFPGPAPHVVQQWKT